MTDSQLNIIIQAQDNASKALNNISSNMQGMGSMATGFTAGAVAGLTNALIGMATAGVGMAVNGIKSLANEFLVASQVAGTFQSAINKLGAISRASAEDLKLMRDQAKSLGDTTIFSATEVANAQQFLAMAGFEVNQVLGATPAVLELAIAGSMDLARAADIASNIMGQFGIEAKDASRVTNVLAATANTANTDILQLSEAMKFLGPTAKSLGMTVEQTAAMIGVLGDAGIQGSMAGQALSSSLVRLAKPTNEMKKAMNQMNLQAFDAQGNFVGMQKLLGQLEKGTRSMTQEQKAANLYALLGAESYQEISILLERGSEAFAQYEKEVTGTTAAQKMAEAQNQGLEASQKSLSSSIEGLQLKFMDLRVGGKAIIDWQTEMTNGFANMIRSIKLEEIAGRIGTFVDSLDFSRITDSLSSIGDNFDLSVGFERAKEMIDVFLESISLVSGTFIDTFNLIVEFFNNTFVPAFQPIIESFQNAWTDAQPLIVSAVNGILMTIQNVLPIVGPILEQWAGYFKQIVDRIAKEIFPELIPLINDFVEMVRVVAPALQPYLMFLVDVFGSAAHLVVGIMKGLILIIRGVIDVIIYLFTGNGERIKSAFVNIFTGIGAIVSAVFRGIFNGIIDVINTGIRITNTGLRATGGTEVALIKKLAVGGQRPEGSFIAGENGPELVTPTKVYTKSQTASMGAIGGNSMSYSIGQLVLQVEGVKLNTENEISDFLDENLKVFKRKLL